MDFCPWGPKGSDTTEWLTLTSTFVRGYLGSKWLLKEIVKGWKGRCWSHINWVTICLNLIICSIYIYSELSITISTLVGNVLLKCTLGISAFSCLLVDFSEVYLYCHKALLYLSESITKAGTGFPLSRFGLWDDPTTRPPAAGGPYVPVPTHCHGVFHGKNGREGGQRGPPDTLHQLWLFAELPLGYLLC